MTLALTAKLASLPAVHTEYGTVHVATRAQIEGHPCWRAAFRDSRKDHRYYQVIEETIEPRFDFQYLVLSGTDGTVRAIQPYFILDQDLLAGAGVRIQGAVDRLRRFHPQLLKMRTLMVGCAAGEGHLGHADDQHASWTADCLHAALAKIARKAKARLVVLKEFPSSYRQPLSCFSNNGYTRVPSLPMTRLSIDFASFDQYMEQVLSKAMRKDLRRKFRRADAAAPISMQVVSDVTPYIDEVYPLYLQVYQRSKLHFEKLTPRFMCELGQRMPDKARFFIWRQKGNAVAFSLCLLEGQSIFDEYLGLDYRIALDLHLYFYTLRDILRWGMAHQYKWYCSSALNYDPKLHLRCELVPLDLYVAHTWPAVNFFLRRLLPWLEPTRNDKTLARFSNYGALWGES